jgi:hypothetical protein
MTRKSVASGDSGNHRERVDACTLAMAHSGDRGGGLDRLARHGRH